jgi:hypothetical protein
MTAQDLKTIKLFEPHQPASKQASKQRHPPVYRPQDVCGVCTLVGAKHVQSDDAGPGGDARHNRRHCWREGGQSAHSVRAGMRQREVLSSTRLGCRLQLASLHAPVLAHPSAASHLTPAHSPLVPWKPSFALSLTPSS